MMGAMYVGISGMKAHMNMMNVIGNNTANVNTFGYKSQRMLFRESIYSTVTSGSNGTSVKGGTNPSQLGYGVQVGTIDLNMASSTYTPTGRAWDCMIDGDGFFMVGDKDQTVRGIDDVSKLTLTRLGDFTKDANGYITDGKGNVLFGYATVQNPEYRPGASQAEIAANPIIGMKTVASTELVPLRLPLMAAVPSLENGGLRADGSTIWDAGSAVYPVLSAYNKTEGQTNLHLDDPLQSPGINVVLESDVADQNIALGTQASLMPIDSEQKCVSLNSLTINKDGSIRGVNGANGETVIIGYIAIASVDNVNGVTHIDGPYYKAMDGAGDIRVGSCGNVLDGQYLNNLKAEDAAASELLLDASEVVNNGLEASGANVADEFANLITTERGYQANCRIITVSDSMLEELVNIKR